MAAGPTREDACPAWDALHGDLLGMTCRVKEITLAVSVATVRVNGGATCTCRRALKGEVPLKKVAEELEVNVGKLMEEILRHAVDAQSVLRERRGREAARDSGYGSRNSEMLREAARDSGYGSRNSKMLRVYPIQETIQLEKPEDGVESSASDGHICVRL